MIPSRTINSRKETVCLARNMLLRRMIKAAIKAMLKKMTEITTEYIVMPIIGYFIRSLRLRRISSSLSIVSEESSSSSTIADKRTGYASSPPGWKRFSR